MLSGPGHRKQLGGGKLPPVESGDPQYIDPSQGPCGPIHAGERVELKSYDLAIELLREACCSSGAGITFDYNPFAWLLCNCCFCTDTGELLINGSAETYAPATYFPYSAGNELDPRALDGWAEADETWGVQDEQPSGTIPVPQAGTVMFFPGSPSSNPTEIYQDIDVSDYSWVIDAGGYKGVFSGYTSSDSVDSDTSKIVVEYRNAVGGVLDSYDTGDVHSAATWVLRADTRPVPVGTRTVRVRLVSTRNAGSNTDGYYDNLSFKLDCATASSSSGAGGSSSSSGVTPSTDCSDCSIDCMFSANPTCTVDWTNSSCPYSPAGGTAVMVCEDGWGWSANIGGFAPSPFTTVTLQCVSNVWQVSIYDNSLCCERLNEPIALVCDAADGHPTGSADLSVLNVCAEGTPPVGTVNVSFT